MPYSALAVANYFVEKALKEKRPLSPMKLQKLVYYAQGWKLGLKGEPLFEDPIQAWQYGPVIPSVYHAFKKYGSGSIVEPVADFIAEDLEFKIPRIPGGDQSVVQLLDKVWQVYSRYTAAQLSDLTHEKGGPWATTVAEKNGVLTERSILIPESLISSYFVNQAAANKDKKDQAA